MTIDWYDPQQPSITDVTAKQRYPWNGKVDIAYTLAGDVTVGLPPETAIVLSVTASNRVDGATYAAAATALSGDTGTAEGAHHVVWDLNAQGLEIKSDEVVFTVAYWEMPPPYCVIDLSGGVDAASYPVSYLADVPSGGFNTDEYKTTKLVLRLVEPGTFMTRGSYQLTLTKPFYCGVFEVTQKQYELVTGDKPSYFNNASCYATRPVEQVSYDMIRGSSAGAGWPGSSAVDGNSFLGKLQARTGLNFDLPTEVQWEYACRAGTTTDYNSGKNNTGSTCANMNEVGRYWYNGGQNSSQSIGVSGGTAKVGAYQPNAWGLYDMHGNVDEWCLDWLDLSNSGLNWWRPSSGLTDPVGSSSGAGRMLRGGSWHDGAGACSSSFRGYGNPSSGGNVCGFRLARTLPNTVSLCAAQSAPTAVDSPVSEDLTVNSITLTWDASWIGGDADAEVVIGDNGVEVKRATGAGEFIYAPIVEGEHFLTYTTYIGGVAQNEVYAASFKREKGIAEAMVGVVDDVVYNGSAFRPEPTVIDSESGYTLVKDIDYTLSWGANTTAGSGSVAVTGKGNYTGTVVRNFTIAKAEVTLPTVASKVYTGGLLKADISATTRYTVQNDGGVNVGSYPVVLTLTDSMDYRWKDGNSNPLSLTFSITKATNSWLTQPSIAGWTYGQAGNAPNLGAAKFGNVQVSYSATPQNAGSYTATFTVPETANYSALSKSVPFAIATATCDMSGAKWDYAGEFKYDGALKTVLVTGLPTGVTVSAYSGNTGSAPGTYTAHAELLYDTTNYNKPEIADLVWGIKSAEETTLKEVFDDLPATIEPDGNGGWTVTITNDIDSADLPIEIPDNLGQVTIDLGGHDIVGGNGADGDDTTPGGDGMPAIVIVAGDGDGEPTVLTIVTSGGDASVKGGDGGAGNPGGDGAPAVEVADGAQDGVVINIGAGVIVQGGDGGASDTGRGGDGGAGIVGNVGTNDGTIVGGNGGSSESGDGGNGGAGVDGDVGVNNGDISGGDGGASEGGDSGDSGEGVTGEVGENNGDILPYALTDEMVGAIANQQFTGVEVKPAPIVYDGVHDKVLEEGVDYVLAWQNNVRPGTATMTATGIGNYRGEVLRDFAIGSPVKLSIQAGEYFKATLAELGYDVPTDGTPYSVVAKGLPAGLKLKYNPAWKNKKGKVAIKAKSEWWIEGVPTAAVDFFTNPPYLVITANGAKTTEPLPVEVLAQNVTELEDLALGQTVNEQFYLPGVTNGWTVSGLPTGLKYTAKRITEKLKSGKQTKTVTKALPYSVYGKTTKAGLFTITAKRKTGAFYETMKYRVLVRPKAPDAALFGEELANITTMAYVPFEWDLTNDVAAVGGKVAKVAGLPVGLAFASATTYKDKKKTQVKQYGQTIVGTPTKPGTYVVTFTKNVKSGKTTVAKTAQILWTVVENDAELELAFNIAGGVIEGGSVGLKYGDLMAFTATDGAAVTASGLPKGIALANLGDGNYAFTGFTEKAGTYLVAVTATLNGKTVTQRMALEVDGLPSWAKGTFNGYIAGVDGATNGLATITVSSVGKISGKFQEGGTNWTFTAASYTGYDSAAPAYSVPVVAKYAYKATEIVKGKKKTVTKSVARDFTLRVGQDALGGMATLEEVGGSAVNAWQNLWGQADYKAIGKQLFSTKSGKKTLAYRTFTIKGTDDVGAEMGLADAMSLSLKVTSAGAVTATMSFDTGTKSKGKAVIYKPTCATVVIPLSAADAEEFEGEVFLFFAPSPANNFPGFVGAAPF